MFAYEHYPKTYILSRKFYAGWIVLWNLSIWKLRYSSRSPESTDLENKNMSIPNLTNLNSTQADDNVHRYELTAYLWDAVSVKEESVADWRSMTLDLLRWRRSCSSSLPGKADSSGVLQAAGDRPLPCREDDGHPGRTRDAGVEAALILATDAENVFNQTKTCLEWVKNWEVNFKANVKREKKEIL